MEEEDSKNLNPYKKIETEPENIFAKLFYPYQTRCLWYLSLKKSKQCPQIVKKRENKELAGTY